jgi:hypothetical protein
MPVFLALVGLLSFSKANSLYWVACGQAINLCGILVRPKLWFITYHSIIHFSWDQHAPTVQTTPTSIMIVVLMSALLDIPLPVKIFVSVVGMASTGMDNNVQKYARWADT